MLKFLRLNHFSFTFLTLFLVTTLQANKLPFEEATIHYKITGNATGTQTTYIRNFGQERVTYIETDSNIMHPDSENRRLIMITPEWIYHINLTTLKGTRKPNLYPHIADNNEEKNILGLACHKKLLAGKSSFVTKEGNLLLHSSVDILGYHEEINAVDIKKGSVNDDLFILPEGVKIVNRQGFIL